jgi:hypothetical protein
MYYVKTPKICRHDSNIKEMMIVIVGCILKNLKVHSSRNVILAGKELKNLVLLYGLGAFELGGISITVTHLL